MFSFFFKKEISEMLVSPRFNISNFSQKDIGEKSLIFSQPDNLIL